MNKNKVINLTNGVITKEILEKIDNIDDVKNALEDGENIILQLGKDIKLPNDCSGLFSNKQYSQIIFEKEIDTSNVTNMSDMFMNSEKLNDISGLEYFNTNNVTTMSGMFDHCYDLTNVDISNFNYDNVEDLTWMFGYDYALSDVKGIDKLLDKVKELSWVKSYGILALTKNSVETDYFELVNIYSTFGIMVESDESNKFDYIVTINKGEINHTSIQEIMTHVIPKGSRCKVILGDGVKLIDKRMDSDRYKFYNDFGIFEYYKGINFDYDIESIEFKPGIDSSTMTDMSNMFSIYIPLKEIKGLENLDTSRVENMRGMFKDCNRLETLDVSNFKTSNVENLAFMFEECNALKEIKGLENFDTRNVENMSAMFKNCLNLENINVSSFDTSKVTYMDSMFGNCKNIKNLDLSNFDTMNVVDMRGMFYGCESLEKLDLTNFNMTNVMEMSNMFKDCEKLYNIDGFKKILNKVDELNNVNELCAFEAFENCDKLFAEKINIDVSEI